MHCIWTCHKYCSCCLNVGSLAIRGRKMCWAELLCMKRKRKAYACKHHHLSPKACARRQFKTAATTAAIWFYSPCSLSCSQGCSILMPEVFFPWRYFLLSLPLPVYHAQFSHLHRTYLLLGFVDLSPAKKQAMQHYLVNVLEPNLLSKILANSKYAWHKWLCASGTETVWFNFKYTSCSSFRFSMHITGASMFMYKWQSIQMLHWLERQQMTSDAGTGYVKTEDMRRILHNVGLRLPYRQSRSCVQQ